MCPTDPATRPAGPGGDASGSALFTDLYELTMAQAYAAEGMAGRAAFEVYFRKLPARRNFALAAGLAPVLDFLESVRFTADEREYLRRDGRFSEAFLDRLSAFRFTGDVEAVPEGTVVFAGEPILRVEAPIIEAQLVETFVLNQIHVGTVAASKAARVVLAAAGRRVVDFGARRAHGVEAALIVARAAWLAGADGTSNVLAGLRYGIPTYGTMAHSYIQAHAAETEAFERFAALYPGSTLLVDTYDSLEGVRGVIDLKRRLGDGFRVRAVRLDSGDLAALAHQTRRLLDEAGLTEVGIFASSALDEYAIAELIRREAPIDGFGVGTRLAVAEDAPDLDMAYKLVEYDGRPTYKLSSGKVLYPGRKQVWRRTREGRMAGDVIGRAGEIQPGEPLLRPVMSAGERLPAGRASLAEARETARRSLAALPEALRGLEPAPEPYEVRVSEELRACLAALSRAPISNA